MGKKRVEYYVQRRDRSGVGYVKRNAFAGHTFESCEVFEAHLAKWERGIANVHGTTGEAAIVRFERDEAHRLPPLDGSIGAVHYLAN